MTENCFCLETLTNFLATKPFIVSKLQLKLSLVNNHDVLTVYTTTMTTMTCRQGCILVLLQILSAILYEYWCKYQRCFSYAVSIQASAILFHIFFGNIRYQYFCRQVH